MNVKFRVSLFAACAFGAAVAVGCMPSEDSINQEVSYVRQRAYDEWKAARDRGESKEATINGPLSIDDAVQLALRYNKELQIEVQNREVARGEKRSAWGVALPSATVTSSWTLKEKRTSESRDSYGFGLSVQQPIWQGDYIPAKLRDAALYSAMVDQNIRSTVEALVKQVSLVYYETLYHQHLLETQREGLRSAEEQLRMITEKRKQETATDLEVLTAQVDVAKYRADTIREQNSIENLRIQLLRLMGCSQESAVTLVNKLEFLPMRPVLERAVQLATTNRADLRIAELDVRREMEAVRIAQSAFFPRVYATLSDSWTSSYRSGDTRSGRKGVAAGLGASYDLGIENWGNLQSARAKQIQKEIALLDAQDEALKQIRTEMNNLANAEEMVGATQVNQDSAREALRLATVGYQAGVKTELDVTNARKQLTEVQAQYYSALYEHTSARVALQVAMGLLGPTYVKDGAQTPPSVPIANIEEFAATDYVPPEPFVSPSSGSRQETNQPRERRPAQGQNQNTSKVRPARERGGLGQAPRGRAKTDAVAFNPATPERPVPVRPAR